MQVRLKAQEKKVDHLERAKRVVEIPMLKEQWTNEEQERIKVKTLNHFGADMKCAVEKPELQSIKCF